MTYLEGDLPYIVFCGKMGMIMNGEMIDMTEMSVAKAWDYAIGLIKVDGLEPTEDFKKYIELEKQGKATTQDLKRYLDKKYKAKGEDNA